MKSEKHIEHELIAYLDGEISAVDEARIKQHLLTCESCRTALKELQLVRRDLGATLDYALNPVQLSREADDRIRQVIQARLERRPLWWQALWQNRGFISQAVMAVFIVFMSVSTLRAVTPSAPVPVHETIVLSQDQFAPGSQGALRVVVQSLGSALPSTVPVQGAQVIVSLAHASGVIQNLYNGQTDATGSAAVTFMMPENIAGDAELIVETTSGAGTERIVRPIHIKRSYKIYLGSDKLTYRPGQTLYVRALVIDAVKDVPTTDETLTFQIFDAKEQKIYETEVNLSEYGIGFTDYQIPEKADIGPYTILATVGDATVERVVEVDLYPPPAFQIALETSESYALPGDIVHGSVSCSYFFGKPVQGSVKFIVYGGDSSVISEKTGTLDAEGVFDFVLELPEIYVGDSLSIVASVLDNAGHIEGIQRNLPLSETPILIRAVPESGRLLPGVENILYLMTAYPDGAPAMTHLQLLIDNDKVNIQTDAFGLALIRFTPEVSSDLYVVARDPEGRVSEKSLSLDTASVHSLLLRAEKAAYAVGETLQLEALVAAPDVTEVYLDVIRGGQTTAVLSAPVRDGSAEFAIDLDATLTGALNLRAYALQDGRVHVQDTRMVVVDPEGSLEITVSSDREVYRPGATAHIDVETTLHKEGQRGTPTQSSIGVAIVDTSVLSLEMLPPGFARTYFLMDNVLLDRRGSIPRFDPPALLEGDELTRQAQDIAAKAAWAGIQNVSYTAESSARIIGIDESSESRAKLARSLSWLLILLPLVLCGLVVEGLLPSGVFWRACRRLGWALLALTVIVPVMIVSLFLGMLLPWLGAALAICLLLVVIVLDIGLIILSWSHNDVRLQLTAGIVTLYVGITVAVLYLATLSVLPSGAWVTTIAVFFLLLLMSLFVLGQGLILEQRRLDGWILTVIVVLLMLLAVSLPAFPQLKSNLSRTMSNPLLYSGPIGWLSGCAPAYSEEPSDTEAPSTEKETEATEMPAPTPSPMATAIPQLPGTATPVTIPLEPYPLRQLFPETLFWSPDVETNLNGSIGLDIQLADSLTTWRLTALGSTKNGVIGAASYDLRVFQDFFVDVEIDDILEVDETSSVILTVYNYLDTAQMVRWEIEPSDDYHIDNIPEILKIGAEEVASTAFEIIPLQTGIIMLDIKAVGDAMVDVIRLELDVSTP